MHDTDLNNRFTYHKPKPGQPDIYMEIRENARGLALILNDRCPDSREKSLAITKLEECVMWANASIARNTEGGVSNAEVK